MNLNDLNRRERIVNLIIYGITAIFLIVVVVLMIMIFVWW
jgi:predicted nucleic acid-binding Zn ribbon protein